MFIICIPTDEEEALLLEKVQSDLAAKCPVQTPTTTKDLRYGTFEVCMYKSQSTGSSLILTCISRRVAQLESPL